MGGKLLKKEISGITLIALVVTIAILIILSLITINIVLGKDGIINATERTKIGHIHHSVWEAMDIEYSAYSVDKARQGGNFIEYLQNKQMIAPEKVDNGYVVNTEKLLGKRLDLGNGTDGKNDVYKLEEIPGDEEYNEQYQLNYYGDSGNWKLGVLGDNSIELAISGGEEEEEESTNVTFQFCSESGASLEENTRIFVYKDKKMQQLVQTVKINGSQAKTKLDNGTYYVIPEQAPEGYTVLNMIECNINADVENLININCREGEVLDVPEDTRIKTTEPTSLTFRISEDVVEDFQYAGAVLDVYLISNYNMETRKFEYIDELKNLGHEGEADLSTYYQGTTITNEIYEGKLTPCVSGSSYEETIYDLDTTGCYFIMIKSGEGDYFDIHGKMCTYRFVNPMVFTNMISGFEHDELVVESGNNNHAFPFGNLLCPNVYDVYGNVMNNSKIGNYIYDHAFGLTPEIEKRTGSLEIITDYNDYGENVPQKIVYGVEATYDEKNVYSNILTVNFKEPGTKTLLVEGIYSGANVKVTQLYSGGSSSLQSEDTQTIEIVADQTAEVTFNNGYNGCILRGAGKQITYNYDENSGWTREVEQEEIQINDISMNIEQGGELEEKIKIKNEGDTGPVYVRAKIYAPSDVQIDLEDSVQGWNLMEDGYFYYDNILEKEINELPVKINPREGFTDFNICIIYEFTPVQYEDGEPYADWSV